MSRNSAHTLALYTTKAVIVLDSEGKRLLAKYYAADYPTLKEQRVFEKALFDKTKKLNSEIVLLDNQVIVYRNSHDVFIYFVGTMDENELILMSTLQAFYEALSMLLAGQVEKRSILENADLVFLALDETIDDGIILESDSTQIAARVTKKDANDGSIPLAEQTIAQALRQAQEQITKSLLNLVDEFTRFVTDDCNFPEELLSVIFDPALEEVMGRDLWTLMEDCFRRGVGGG
ncbi:Coatomer subunit zeta-1 [Physocladia obscura]|uniref:Coatomer subunit zeta n=1 Tax=Physocladia obscura TaxID=109957 RepID=A0AAD5TBC2_9FUNG|nr:Coatomer subunit zeta-1 [Physocladia obscura]